MIDWFLLVMCGYSFLCGWAAKDIHQHRKSAPDTYAQGVADERAASRKRGQELAEAIAKRRHSLEA